MEIKVIVLQLFTAFLGAFGFAVLFHMRKRLLLPAAIGGLLNWGVYLYMSTRVPGVFVPCLIGSIVAALYAETLARALKAPATLFLLPAIIPSVPGSTLFYTMRYAVSGDWSVSRMYGILTMQYALAIAVGISLVWAMWVMINRLLQNGGTTKAC